MLHWKQRYFLATFMVVMIIPETLWSIEGGQTDVSSKVTVTSDPVIKGVEQVGNHTPTATVFHVKDSNFSAEVLNEKLPVLVGYWAEWAGPAKMISPILKDIAEAYVGRLKVVKLNIDENPQSTQKYKIRGIPTLMLFAKGEIISTKVGILSKDQLIAWLDENLKR